ncbi:MAG: HD domain-containing phosphohydrolase [bacterium]
MSHSKEVEKGILVARWILLILVMFVVFSLPGARGDSLGWNMRLLRLILIGGAAYTLFLTGMLSLYQSAWYHYTGWVLDFLFYSALVYFTGGSKSIFVFLFYALAFFAGMGRTWMEGISGTLLIFLASPLFHFMGGRGPLQLSNFLAHGGMVLLSGWCGIGLLPFSRSTSESPVEDRDQLLEESYRISRDHIKAMEAREREFGEIVRKFETLMYLNRLMGSTGDMRELMETIVTRARDEMNSQISFLMLISDNKLKPAYSLGISELTGEILETPVDQGVLGSVVTTGQPVRMSEKDENSRLQEFVGSVEHFRNILCVPLITPQKKEIIGLLAVANSLSGEPYRQDQEEYLASLAGDASMFLRQMSLLADLKSAYADLEKSYLETVFALAQAVELRDKYTRGHIGRVKNYALKLAKELKVPAQVLSVIAKAAILHDIGKIGTPDSILLKPGKLTDEEFAEMRKHAEQSALVLKDLSSMPPEVVKLVRHHHERHDGKGYPDGLKGNEIPVGAQVIAVADVFDALTTDRPYRKGFSVEKALEIMMEASGTQFNPGVLKAFIGLVDEQRKNLELTIEKEP